ncbi:hypothetical protein ACLOJK_005616 [Asimina triloba]
MLLRSGVAGGGAAMADCWSAWDGWLARGWIVRLEIRWRMCSCWRTVLIGRDGFDKGMGSWAANDAGDAGSGVGASKRWLDACVELLDLAVGVVLSF